MWQDGERAAAQQAVLASSIGGQLLGMPYLAEVGAGPAPSKTLPVSTTIGATADQAEDPETRRSSNPAQQERNRQAQQRYRERKKAKQARGAALSRPRRGACLVDTPAAPHHHTHAYTFTYTYPHTPLPPPTCPPINTTPRLGHRQSWSGR